MRVSLRRARLNAVASASNVSVSVSASVIASAIASAIAIAALAACGGSHAHQGPRSSRATTTCAETLDHIEALAGDLDRGLTAGPIAGFEGLGSRREWREACAQFSPWVRRCLFLSTVRQELSSCEPGSEPWSRRHEFGDVPPDEKQEFLSCVNASVDRRELSRCNYDR